MLKIVGLVLVVLANPASAQLFAPGAAVYPSPAPRASLDAPVAQCVIARPCPYGGDCVVLSPCPAGTLVPPTQLPAPGPTPPEARPIIIQVLPAPPPEAAPPAEPRAATPKAPKTPKKMCPCP